MLKIIDLKMIGNFCRSKGIISVIDNTFASPINQNPAGFGIDITVHSGTKYLSGHSDVCCGAAVGSADLVRRI